MEGQLHPGQVSGETWSHPIPVARQRGESGCVSLRTAQVSSQQYTYMPSFARMRVNENIHSNVSLSFIFFALGQRQNCRIWKSMVRSQLNRHDGSSGCTECVSSELCTNSRANSANSGANSASSAEVCTKVFFGPKSAFRSRRVRVRTRGVYFRFFLKN